MSEGLLLSLAAGCGLGAALLALRWAWTAHRRLDALTGPAPAPPDPAAETLPFPPGTTDEPPQADLKRELTMWDDFPSRGELNKKPPAPPRGEEY